MPTLRKDKRLRPQKLALSKSYLVDQILTQSANTPPGAAARKYNFRPPESMSNSDDYAKNTSALSPDLPVSWFSEARSSRRRASVGATCGRLLRHQRFRWHATWAPRGAVSLHGCARSRASPNAGPGATSARETGPPVRARRRCHVALPKLGQPLAPHGFEEVSRGFRGERRRVRVRAAGMADVSR